MAPLSVPRSDTFFTSGEGFLPFSCRCASLLNWSFLEFRKPGARRGLLRYLRVLPTCGDFSLGQQGPFFVFRCFLAFRKGAPRY